MTVRPIPVDREVVWDKTKIIVSETDSLGVITSVNNVFSEVSGYTTAELIGQPHNIIRHPDMPRIVFKMLWDNLKKGNNFFGIIKNMTKQGEYYWVITDFEMRRDTFGNITHYIGVRKAVPQSVITNHIAPFYETLLRLEKIGGMELSGRFFKNYLVKQGKDYTDFVIDIMSETSKEAISAEVFSSVMDKNNTVVSDDIYHVNEQANLRRKSFFEKLFL